MTLAGCVLGLLSAAHAATVLISNPDGELKAAKVLDNYVLVGLVGDHVVLNPGDHELRIDAPRAYTLVIALRVDGEGVKIVDSRTEPGNCKPNFETTWDAPTIVGRDATASAAKKAKKARADAAVAPIREVTQNGMTLLVSTPKFGKPSNRGSCWAPSMLACAKQFTIVAVDSVPPGGEIWVDGERTNVMTKGTLSVPFCPGREKTKSLLVRMSGRVTCLRDVTMSESGRVEVTCELPLPQ
jgi:hypothetical protein